MHFLKILCIITIMILLEVLLMRIERLNKMEQYILKMGTVSLENLTMQFNISMNTVRRDIDELIKRGTIRKVYLQNCYQHLLIFQSEKVRIVKKKK